MSHREESFIKMERLGETEVQSSGWENPEVSSRHFSGATLQDWDYLFFGSVLNTAVKPSGTGAFWKGDDNSISVSLRVMILRP